MPAVVKKVIPNIKPEDIQAIYDKTDYETEIEVFKDILSLKKYCIVLSQQFADADYDYIVKEQKYKESIGRNLKEAIGFSYQEKTSYILAHDTETNNAYTLACDARYKKTVIEGRLKSVEEMSNALKGIAFNLRR